MDKRHWWWAAKDLAEFYFNYAYYIAECGIENVRVEFHPSEELDGRKGVIKIVDRRDGTVLGTYNYAHTCPPDCDDGE